MNWRERAREREEGRAEEVGERERGERERGERERERESKREKETLTHKTAASFYISPPVLWQSACHKILYPIVINEIITAGCLSCGCGHDHIHSAVSV